MDQPPRLDALARTLPKAELHVHIEGTLEPELMMDLAGRNRVNVGYDDVAAVRAAYDFADLQSFLDLYYQGAAVLQTEADFSDLAFQYLDRVRTEGVRHVEMFFDPQTHTDRGVPFHVVIEGLVDGIERSRVRAGPTVELIMCFLRHLTEHEALETLEEAMPFADHIIGVGLDSAEEGNPPSKFERVYREARSAGMRCVAHAGEEGPPGYVWEAIDVLGVERIDHGVRSLEDTVLVERLVSDRIPLTVCPLSNRKLQVTPDLATHPLPRMIEAGLLVSINSDDPAYFGGYIADNYNAAGSAMGLGAETLIAVAKNSFVSSFLEPPIVRSHVAEVDEVVMTLGLTA